MAEPEGLNWRSGRLAEAEYTALSAHYFHEDNYFLRAFGLFGTINTALITLFGTNVIVNVQHSLVRFAFIFIGSVTTVIWLISLIRVRYLRRCTEERIKKLEEEINEYWENSRDRPPFALLKIRNRQESARYWFQLWPVSRIMLFIPVAFLMVWLGLATVLILGISISIGGAPVGGPG